LRMKADRRFRDRVEAGQELGRLLLGRYKTAGWSDVIVLGLARGGVPVAAEVAATLDAPLEVLAVRKVGVPGHDEVAMGAVGPGGATLLDRALIASLCLPSAAVTVAVERERKELQRRETAYRNGRPSPVLRGRTVIVVDDGLATGATMTVAVAVVRAARPARVVVAVPVAARDALAQLSEVADDVVSVMAPEPFHAVGVWYDDFSATSDEEVRRLLGRGDRRGRVA
jgi:putative phosphoribosyl transferase